MAVFNCPQCGHAQAVDDKHIGKTATCPKCKTQRVVVADTDQTQAQQEPAWEVPTQKTTRSRSAGPAGTFRNLGPQHDYHPGSSLLLEWILLDDPAMKLVFTDTCGPKAIWRGRQTMFEAEVEVLCLDACLTAIDIHFLVFSVWGNHLTTLNARRITDIPPNTRYKDKYSWYASDTHASEYLASIGYVARVRTLDGMILESDPQFILREAKRFSERFSEADLEPKSPKD
jgi:hypothetical protein